MLLESHWARVDTVSMFFGDKTSAVFPRNDACAEARLVEEARIAAMQGEDYSYHDVLRAVKLLQRRVAGSGGVVAVSTESNRGKPGP